MKEAFVLQQKDVNSNDSDYNHLLVIEGCTYEIKPIFDDKIKLEDIIAQRILKSSENTTS